MMMKIDDNIFFLTGPKADHVNELRIMNDTARYVKHSWASLLLKVTSVKR